jgi:hypothetical protein
MNDMIGHNSGDQAQRIREDLDIKHADISKRKADLLEACARAPDVIVDDDQAGRAGDFIKQILACVKAADTARVAEKEPFLAGGRTVDGYFKAITDPLDKAKADVKRRITPYLREKDAAERRIREANARIEREAAEAKRKEAEAAAASMQSQEALDDAVAAETAAKKAAADAATADKAANVNAAELSRTRGDYGSVASLVTFWDFKDLDRDRIDLNALRQHIPVDALEKAVRSFIKSGGRTLLGVTIFENTKARVA